MILSSFFIILLFSACFFSVTNATMYNFPFMPSSSSSGYDNQGLPSFYGQAFENMKAQYINREAPIINHCLLGKNKNHKEQQQEMLVQLAPNTLLVPVNQQNMHQFAMLPMFNNNKNNNNNYKNYGQEEITMPADDLITNVGCDCTNVLCESYKTCLCARNKPICIDTKLELCVSPQTGETYAC